MKPLTITNRLTNRGTDSFKQYLRDVAEIPLFTQQEELECCVKVSNGDADAIQELVRRNLRFVISVAKQYVTSTNQIEDLVNEGNIGLIKAANRFDHKKGYRFISYAVYWIQKTILEHIDKYGKAVRLPANKITNLSKLDKKINYLEQKLGRQVDILEIISELKHDMGVTDTYDEDGKPNKDKLGDEYAYLDVLGTYSMDSLDREIYDNKEQSSTTLGDLLSDSSFKGTDNLIIESDTKQEIGRMIETLKPRDKRIMTALYGLDGSTPMTLKEIGEEIGVTREMIRQIKEKCLLGFRKKLMNSTLRTCQ